MDAAKAQDVAKRVIGKQIGRWRAQSYINHGKSAVVFKATDGAQEAALKIFDAELIERFGDHTQLARIQRELTLVGQTHPNLVQILDGGQDPASDSYYVAMAYLPGKNLKECLQDVPHENIPSLISQLASAAQFLETLGIVHRDIKPENVMLLDRFERLVLLDLGVIRPIGGSSLTDGEGIKAFVGTLQYSSPEFLLRQEQDTPEGWRALTFYQIGAVIHDLIMRQPLFASYCDPYARLVNAIQYEHPVIQNSATPVHLIELARSCLIKDPKVRAKLVTWTSFTAQSSVSTGESAKQRVTNRTIANKALDRLSNTPAPTSEVREATLEITYTYISEAIRLIRSDNAVFPPVNVARPTANAVRVRFQRSMEHGLPGGLLICIAIEVLDESARAIVLSLAAYVGQGTEGEPVYTEFFKGLFDTSAIHAKLEGAIYSAIDAAQKEAIANNNAVIGKWLVMPEIA